MMNENMTSINYFCFQKIQFKTSLNKFFIILVLPCHQKQDYNFSQSYLDD